MGKIVVFDMDGIIFDTEKLIWNIWCEIGAKYNIADIEETLRACLGVNLAGTKALFMQKYGEMFPYDVYRKEADSLRLKSIENNGIPLKEGVYELLEFLKLEGYRIALASSTTVEMIKEELSQAGILDYFEVIVGGDMVKHSKPHPEIYQMACEKLKVKPEECIAIEDSFNGLKAAHAAGLKPIMVPDLMEPNEEIERILYRKYRSLLEVKAFLETQV